jgi:hypothetical protein
VGDDLQRVEVVNLVGYVLGRLKKGEGFLLLAL